MLFTRTTQTSSSYAFREVRLEFGKNPNESLRVRFWNHRFMKYKPTNIAARITKLNVIRVGPVWLGSSVSRLPDFSAIIFMNSSNFNFFNKLSLFSSFVFKLSRVNLHTTPFVFKL